MRNWHGKPGLVRHDWLMASGRTRRTYPETFASLARSLAEAGGVRPTIEQIVARSVNLVPSDWAAIAVAGKMGDRPPGLAATNDAELMDTVAEIAGRIGCSPGLTAFSTGSKVYLPDLAAQSAWDAYASEMLQRTPIRSVLSFGLQLHRRPLGVLTFYRSAPDGFDGDAQRRGSLLADHATIAIDAATSAESADGFKAALARSRAIGTAIGVLAERHRFSPEEAFDMLRVVSNHTNRKLADLADEFMSTGELPEP
jgi:GAF domain-containing protein